MPGRPHAAADHRSYAKAPEESRFRIFIIDSEANPTAHKVLQENFGLICDLQKEASIYVLGRQQSIEYMRHHQERGSVGIRSSPCTISPSWIKVAPTTSTASACISASSGRRNRLSRPCRTLSVF